MCTVKDVTLDATADDLLQLLASSCCCLSQGVMIIDTGSHSSSHATAASGTTGTIVCSNAAFEQLMGYSQAELSGSSWNKLCGPATDPSHIAKIEHALHAGEALELRLQMYRKDGISFWNEIRMAPIPNDCQAVTSAGAIGACSSSSRCGRPTRFVVLHRDITVGQALRQELAEQVRRMETEPPLLHLHCRIT